MKYISNSFSPKMLQGKKSKVSFKKISKENFEKQLLTGKSIIGHKNIADILGIEKNRESVKLEHGDVLYCVLAKANRLGENQFLIKDEDSFIYYQCKV